MRAIKDSFTDNGVCLVFFHFVDWDKVKCHARKVNFFLAFFNDCVIVEGHFIVILQVGVLLICRLQSTATHVKDLAKGKHNVQSSMQWPKQNNNPPQPIFLQRFCDSTHAMQKRSGCSVEVVQQ